MYYMPVILNNIGITSSSQQLLLNGVNAIFGIVSGIAGSFCVEGINTSATALATRDEMFNKDLKETSHKQTMNSARCTCPFI